MARIFKFNVDIACANCVIPLEQALQNCRSLNTKSSVDILEKIITITVNNPAKNDTEIQTILEETIANTGIDYSLNEIINETEISLPEISLSPPIISRTQKKIRNKKKIIRSYWIKGTIGLLYGLGMLILMSTGIAIPMTVMYGLITFSTALTLFLGQESYREAAKKLVKTKTLTMDSLFTLSSITVVAVSVASLFFPWLSMMLDAGALIFGFRYIGKGIQASIQQKINDELNFKQRAPQQIEKLTAEKWTFFPVANLQKNDVIQIRGGEIIPVDGISLSDDTEIDDTIISGATTPRLLKKNTRVLAGMRIPPYVTTIQIKATQPFSHSYLAHLDNKIAQANLEKAPLEIKANKILQYFIPAIIAFALISGIIIGVVFNPALAIQCAASLLVSACPCTLGFINPLAFKVGQGKALDHGVRFKNNKSLQSADQIDAVFFDLNGTLTQGNPIVVDYRICTENQILLKDFFNYLATLEKNSTHPIAKAIYQFAIQENAQELSFTDLDQSHHAGIKAKMGDDWCLMGNKNYMLQQGIDMSAFHDDESIAHRIYLVRNQIIIGYVLLKDPLRKDAHFAINELKQMGKEIYICTGADKEIAHHYAKKLNIPTDHVFSNCIGTAETNQNSKIYHIHRMQQQKKRVAMIGDASNDALAIAKSDFGIAVQSLASDEITQQNAGATIKQSSLLPIISTFAIANETIKSIKQNLLISLTYNSIMLLIAGGILIACGFALNPGIGVALMILQTSFILLNQYRIRRQELAHMKRAKELISNQTIRNDDQFSYQQFYRLGMVTDKKIVNEEGISLIPTPVDKISLTHHDLTPHYNSPRLT